uniref:Uncharacterized protein n=1 Tax=Raphanus sativus TaxID=3726 RepID=A0A650GA99_RAPSA|nr:hypothetical protein [Raphanus sativus]
MEKRINELVEILFIIFRSRYRALLFDLIASTIWLYLALGFLNVFIKKTVLIYNRRLGVPVDYCAKWQSSFIEGHYIEGWKENFLR